MNIVTILIEGYAQVDTTGWIASSTVTLVTTDSGQCIIIDPGCNKEKLFNAIEKHNLSIDQIDYVFLTHHHVDHALNAGLFPQAKIVDFEAIYSQDVGVIRPDRIPETDIQILNTPGHEYGHSSLVIPTKKGIVVAAGDVFWWEDGEEQTLAIDKKDDFATDIQILKESRRKVLSLADWIIPGHGRMMENVQA